MDEWVKGGLAGIHLRAEVCNEIFSATLLSSVRDVLILCIIDSDLTDFALSSNHFSLVPSFLFSSSSSSFLFSSPFFSLWMNSVVERVIRAEEKCLCARVLKTRDLAFFETLRRSTHKLALLFIYLTDLL